MPAANLPSFSTLLAAAPDAGERNAFAICQAFVELSESLAAAPEVDQVHALLISWLDHSSEHVAKAAARALMVAKPPCTLALEPVRAWIANREKDRLWGAKGFLLDLIEGWGEAASACAHDVVNLVERRPFDDLVTLAVQALGALGCRDEAVIDCLTDVKEEHHCPAAKRAAEESLKRLGCG